MSPVPVFGEVSLVAKASHDIGELIGSISVKELEEVRSLLSNPPAVVQRTLEVACLILHAGRHKASGKPLGPPDWASVQRTLTHAEFPTQVLEYDIEKLRNAPDLCTYIVNEYFKPRTPNLSPVSGLLANMRRHSQPRASSPAGIRRRSSVTQEPLTFARVRRASLAAGALFQWCVEVTQAAAEVAELTEPPPPPLVVEQENTPTPSPRTPVKRQAPVDNMFARAKAKSQREPLLQRPNNTNASRYETPRHFECLITFPDGVTTAGPAQVAQLRLLTDAIQRRPQLTLRMARYSYSACLGYDPTGEQRLYSAQLFFAAQGVPFEQTAPEEAEAKDGVEGVLCSLHLDGDEELHESIKHGPARKSVDALCPCGHVLKTRFAEAACECHGCNKEFRAGSWLFSCECCSLCDGCFGKLSLGNRDPELVKFARWLCETFTMR